MSARKPAPPRRHCTNRPGGVRCTNLAQRGKKFCKECAVDRISEDPTLRANSRANLDRGRGGSHGNQHTTKRFERDPAAIAARAAALEAEVLVRDRDGNVPPALRRLAQMAGPIEAELDWLAAKPNLTARDERRRELLERRLDSYLERLGMSARAVLDYEPVRRQQEAKQHRVVPADDLDHQREVIGLLLGVGALGPVGAEFAREHDAEHSGRYALFADDEFEELIDSADGTEPVEHIPEAAAPPSAALSVLVRPPEKEQQ